MNVKQYKQTTVMTMSADGGWATLMGHKEVRGASYDKRGK